LLACRALLRNPPERCDVIRYTGLSRRLLLVVVTGVVPLVAAVLLGVLLEHHLRMVELERELAALAAADPNRFTTDLGQRASHLAWGYWPYGLGLAALAVIALSWLLAEHTVARPIRRLTVFAEQIRRGERNPRLDHRGGVEELDRLAAALEAIGADRAPRPDAGDAGGGLYRELAERDPLTGLPNPRLFEAALAETRAAAMLSSRGFAVLVIQLDRFGLVNQQHGEEIGDSVLKSIAGRLAAAARSTDLVARLGEDKFGLLLRELGGEAAAAGVIAERIVRGIARPLRLDGRQPGVILHLTASVGIATFPEDGSSPEALLHSAERALHAAQSQGGGWRGTPGSEDGSRPRLQVISTGRS
jgi:diguanylate cyclase (GGDEF)-like protein